MIRLIINGASGRMGKLIIQLVGNRNNMEISSLHDITHPFDNQTEGDILIDFSSPEGFEKALEFSVEKKIPFISGTTAIGDDRYKMMEMFINDIKIFYSPNMSLGINFIYKFLSENKKFLSKYQMEIVETHHSKKKDAPSGTAKLLMSAFDKTFPFHSLRIGGIPGDHCMYFADEGEMIKIEHRAISREVFAKGALEIVPWLIEQKPGFYTMNDFLDY